MLRPLEPSDCTYGREILCVDAGQHTRWLCQGARYHIHQFHPWGEYYSDNKLDCMFPGIVTLCELSEREPYRVNPAIVLMLRVGFFLHCFRIEEPETKSEERKTAIPQLTHG